MTLLEKIVERFVTQGCGKGASEANGMGWIGKAERYFRLRGAQEEKLEMVMVAIEGNALSWLNSRKCASQIISLGLVSKMLSFKDSNRF